MSSKSVFTGEYELLLRRLISARDAAGLTQHQLALRLNRPQSFVSKYERGERRLDVVEFVTICRILAIDPSSIVGDIANLSAELSHRDEDTPR
ncbi:MAG: helix-turn-helix transcriptional regulator [Gemmatimonadetes bacterium]|nr:helix-turn-helix transcriptional regulator [Dehalococcoidia bacterium]MYJ12230.1 helix-turn-helix transcriptional regulator [Gemmatimonadota bacterium]